MLFKGDAQRTATQRPLFRNVEGTSLHLWNSIIKIELTSIFLGYTVISTINFLSWKSNTLYKAKIIRMYVYLWIIICWSFCSPWSTITKVFFIFICAFRARRAFGGCLSIVENSSRPAYSLFSSALRKFRSSTNGHDANPTMVVTLSIIKSHFISSISL